jgi:hypothetical protein
LIGQVLGKPGGDRRSEKAKENQVREAKLKSGTMTSAYLRASLARDHPEILARCSANIAAPGAARKQSEIKIDSLP